MAVPKDRDSILTTPAESTVTGVPSSENLKHKNEEYKGLHLQWENLFTEVRVGVRGLEVQVEVAIRKP